MPRCRILSLQLFANPLEQWIDFDQKLLGRQSSQTGIPEPFVSHGTDAAFYVFGIGNTAKRRGNHVAVLEG